jgi:hypothetical protein
MKTLAAWTIRYCSFAFCGSSEEAFDFAFRFLAAQVRDIEGMSKALTKEQAPHLRAPPHLTALSRDELVAILTEIVQATRTRLSEARPADGLKAA